MSICNTGRETRNLNLVALELYQHVGKKKIPETNKQKKSPQNTSKTKNHPKYPSNKQTNKLTNEDPTHKYFNMYIEMSLTFVLKYYKQICFFENPHHLTEMNIWVFYSKLKGSFHFKSVSEFHLLTHEEQVMSLVTDYILIKKKKTEIKYSDPRTQHTSRKVNFLLINSNVKCLKRNYSVLYWQNSILNGIPFFGHFLLNRATLPLNKKYHTGWI